MFGSKTHSKDYHGEMNKDNFVTWFQNQLIGNLSEPSLIILDNAPYHSMLKNKPPNGSWKKQDIQNWLTEQKIEFHTTMFKTELLQLVTR